MAADCYRKIVTCTELYRQMLVRASHAVSGGVLSCVSSRVSVVSGTWCHNTVSTWTP